MKSIADEIVDYSSKSPCFVNFFNGSNALKMPVEFASKNEDCLIGRNFITQENVTLDLQNISGFTWYDNNQTEYFNKTVQDIKNKIKHVELLTKDYNFQYSFDKRNLYYIDDANSIALIAFDVEKIENFYNNVNIEDNKERFKNIISVVAEHAKQTIKRESNDYIKDNDSVSMESAEEINAIIDIIDESINNLNTNFDSARDLLFEAWPPLLSPNPFVLQL